MEIKKISTQGTISIITMKDVSKDFIRNMLKEMLRIEGEHLSIGDRLVSEARIIELNKDEQPPEDSLRSFTFRGEVYNKSEYVMRCYRNIPDSPGVVLMLVKHGAIITDPLEQLSEKKESALA